ncbi:hypothetical protein K1F50_19390 [Muricauda oceani]|uniref:Collagen-like protein n=1 Tax=Flagellimonas oceani TaxID=2698672 RepID=A0A6G7IY52_9FLAO|nr:hypothetical protein [Allomuricauda oceani]MBW8244980.1 hypothetical protein [Allomuricauda oceani]QII43319.1 hypothetical protein GVT53_00980 [Allomuricauda oceani]
MKTFCPNVNKFVHIAILSLVTLLLSCSGEDGEDGETGPAGKDGKDGNANVIVSDWMPIVWTWKNLETGDAIFDVPVENISTFMENGGVALMYFKIGSNAKPLPSYYGNSDYLDFSYGEFPENATYQTQAFKGFRIFFDGQPITINIFQSEPEKVGIRYVLVPADVALNSDLSTNSSGSFEEIMAVLGINLDQ